jgi:tRNA modification GTPase
MFHDTEAPPAGEILTNSRQADAVGRALASIEGAIAAMEQGYTPDAVLTEAENAMYALGELTGKTLREDVTSRIFERFCVGK